MFRAIGHNKHASLPSMADPGSQTPWEPRVQTKKISRNKKHLRPLKHHPGLRVSGCERTPTQGRNWLARIILGKNRKLPGPTYWSSSLLQGGLVKRSALLFNAPRLSPSPKLPCKALGKCAQEAGKGGGQKGRDRVFRLTRAQGYGGGDVLHSEVTVKFTRQTQTSLPG